LLSKKYGVKLAKFTHTSSSIIYASTKQNGTVSPKLSSPGG
jgi:COMPASS component SWD2